MNEGIFLMLFDRIRKAFDANKANKVEGGLSDYKLRSIFYEIELHRYEHVGGDLCWFPWIERGIVQQAWSYLEGIISNFRQGSKPYAPRSKQWETAVVLRWWVESAAVLKSEHKLVSIYKEGLCLYGKRYRDYAEVMPDGPDNLQTWGERQVIQLYKLRNRMSHQTFDKCAADFIDVLFVSVLVHHAYLYDSCLKLIVRQFFQEMTQEAREIKRRQFDF